jgi:hypothetical protein
MTIQKINIGNIVNDGLGDDLRTAFQKVNSNFSELDSRSAITAANIGGVGQGIFKQKANNVLQFKNLLAGSGINIFENTDTLEITSRAIAGISTDSGSASPSGNLSVEIKGGRAQFSLPTSTPDIVVTATGSEITIRNKISVTDILTTFDFGPIEGQYNNVIPFLLSASNIDFGSIDYPSSLNLDLANITN